MNDVIFVGVDDGFAETKVSFPNGGRFSILSRAVAGTLNRVSIDGSEMKMWSYDTSDGSFMIGDIERADPTNFDQYPVSALNRVIVNHALVMAGLGGKQIKICSGLPIKSFYRGRKINKDLVTSKKNNLLLGDIKSEDNAPLPIILEHDVISEGIAAWVDYVVQRKGDDLSINPGLAKQRIAIVDIGGRTTDIAVIRDWQLDLSRSSTIEAGMLKVYEFIKDRIHEDHGVEPDDYEVMRAASKGVMKLWGKNYNVKDIVFDAKEVAASHMKGEIMRRLGNASDIDRVMFVGGGALAFGEMIANLFPHQHIEHDSAFCNARGMQKYAELVMTGKD